MPGDGQPVDLLAPSPHLGPQQSLHFAPPQWPAGLAPTSAGHPASVCRAHRGPTRTGSASSAAPHAPAVTGWAWLVPATYPSAEVSRGPASEESRAGARGTSCLPRGSQSQARGGGRQRSRTYRAPCRPTACAQVHGGSRRWAALCALQNPPCRSERTLQPITCSRGSL